jgi:hypothetical protein
MLWRKCAKLGWQCMAPSYCGGGPKCHLFICISSNDLLAEEPSSSTMSVQSCQYAVSSFNADENEPEN